MRKVLILGGSGLVGTTLIEKAINFFEVVATYQNNKIIQNGCKAIKFSIKKENKEIISSILCEERPDVVVNAVSFSNVDFCETHRDDAYFLHVISTKKILEICNEKGIKLIQFSTDWVFDGKKNLYTESDMPNPLNYYGHTRLLAEQVVLKNSNNHAVLRPAIIYGWNPNSRFLNFVINNLKSGKTINTFTDQYSTPTLVDDLANCIIRIIESNTSGLYHTTGSTCLNRFEFAKIIAKRFGLNEKLIKPVNSNEMKQLARRPPKSCLDNSKAKREIGTQFATVEEGVGKVWKKSNVS